MQLATPFGGRHRGKGREPVRARRSFNLTFRHATEPSCRKRVAHTRDENARPRGRARVHSRACVSADARNEEEHARVRPRWKQVENVSAAEEGRQGETRVRHSFH